VIRIGIIGCNYGGNVHLPAFRHDLRCSVVALAGSDAARTQGLAKESGIALAFGDWRKLVEHPDVDAVTISIPPELQPSVAVYALSLSKPVFAEKPMAADLAGADAMVGAALSSRRANMIDFNFTAIPAWLKAKELLDEGAIGRLRHVAVNWHVENFVTLMRVRNWKSSGTLGGGVLGNFVSHCLHYLEWMCGPIDRLSAHLSGLPGEGDLETNTIVSMNLQSGAVGSIVMSCASYNGSGHRVEFYGEDGTLSLINPTRDHMRGFELRLARRPSDASSIDVDDPLDRDFTEDGRIAPVARLAARFLDAIESGTEAAPGFAEGRRVQVLLDAARSSDKSGGWVDVRSEHSGTQR
jgi:predicted dehydrogenase